MRSMSESEHRVFFDLQIAQQKVGRIVCELRTAHLPKICHMIRQLCSKNSFTGTQVDKIVRKEYIQGFHISAETFLEKGVSFVEQCESGYQNHMMHDTFGLLSLCTNEEEGSLKLSITVKESSSLTEDSVVIGRVVKGMGAVKRCEYIAVDPTTMRPTISVLIIGCGSLEREENDGVSPVDSSDGDTFPEYVDDFSSRIDDRIDASNEIRKIGNEFFNKGDCAKALLKYEKAFRYLAPGLCSFEETQKLDQQEAIVLGNIAAVKMRTKEYDHVKEICSKILQLDSKNVKALFRRGYASYVMNDLDQAKTDFQAALSPEQNACEIEITAIRSWLQKTELAIANHAAKEKKTFSKLFA